jgi:hypothetical protein
MLRILWLIKKLTYPKKSALYVNDHLHGGNAGKNSGMILSIALNAAAEKDVFINNHKSHQK